jgi:hypothetical protein
MRRSGGLVAVDVTAAEEARYTGPFGSPLAQTARDGPDYAAVRAAQSGYGSDYTAASVPASTSSK